MIDEFMAEDDLELVEVHINMKTIYTSTKKLSCHLRAICFDYVVLDCTIWLIAVFKNLFLHVLLKICFNFDNFDNKNAIGLVITRTFINSFEPKNIFSQRSTIPLKADHTLKSSRTS